MMVNGLMINYAYIYQSSVEHSVCELNDHQNITFLCRFGSGSGTIWLDDVRCSGGEACLLSCSNNGIGSHNCNHSADVAIFCADTGIPGTGIPGTGIPGTGIPSTDCTFIDTAPTTEIPTTTTPTIGLTGMYLLSF